MSEYSYSKKQIFNREPYHYQYTKFEGKSFLQKYLKSRYSFLSCLKTEDSYLQFDGKKNNVSNYFKSKFFPNYDIEKIYDYMRTNKNTKFTLFINCLMQKYEVSKKIRFQYGPKLKKVTNKGADINSYCYFSGILSLKYKYEQDIRYLNTLLKVNDLLCKNKNIIISLKPKQILFDSINIEIDSIKLLLRKNEIQINE